jgi:hypothetical protein
MKAHQLLIVAIGMTSIHLCQAGAQTVAFGEVGPEVEHFPRWALTERESTAFAAVGPSAPIASSDIVEAAQKACPKLSASLGTDKVLRRAVEDSKLRGTVIGTVAENDFFARNPEYFRSRKANAPQNDGWRWKNGTVGGTREGVQVKTHADWKDYLRSMKKDNKAERFVIPDDHYELVEKDLEVRRLGALKGGDTQKAAYYVGQQRRLTKLGRSYTEYEQSITRTAYGMGKARVASAGASVGKVATSATVAGNAIKAAGGALTVAGGLGAAVQIHDGFNELSKGNVADGTVSLAGGGANLTSAVASLAGRAALGGSAGAVGAGIDGINDIRIGIKNGDKEKTVCGGVKSAAAVAMAAGTATCQPEIVIAGAAVYGGAVVADVAYQNREAISNGMESGLAYSRTQIARASWGCQRTIYHTQRKVNHELNYWQRTGLRAYGDLRSWLF